MSKNIENNNFKWLTLVIVCMGLFMILLDTSVVNLAIPAIMNTFGAAIDQIEWINNGYILSFAMLLVLMGQLGDKYGPKKLFLFGLVVFTLGSMCTGISKSIEMMILFRVIQGIGGAAMMPATLSIISLTFPPKERGTAMGVWGAISGLAIVLGPIIGGYLTTLGLGSVINNFLHINDFWRYVFYINVPVGIVTFIIGWKMIKNIIVPQNKKMQFDYTGMILLALSIFLFTYALIEGQTFGWFYALKDVKILGIGLNGLSIVPLLIMTSIFLFIIFIGHEKKFALDPFINFKLFKDRNYSVGNISAMLFNMVMMGTFFILPLFLQGILGFTPIKAGENILPFALAIMVAAPISGGLSDKIGSKYLIFFGLILTALGEYFLGGLNIDTTSKELIMPYIMMGLGMGMVISPLTKITLIDISEEESGSASGIYSTVRQIGSVLGIAVLGAVLQIGINSYMITNIESASGFSKDTATEINKLSNQKNIEYDPGQIDAIYRSEINDFLNKKGLNINSPADQEKIKNELILLKKESFVESTNKTFHLAAIISIISAVAALAFKKEDLSKKKSAVVAVG